MTIVQVVKNRYRLSWLASSCCRSLVESNWKHSDNFHHVFFYFIFFTFVDIGHRILFVVHRAWIADKQTPATSTENRAGHHGHPSRLFQSFRQQSPFFGHFHAPHWKCRYHGNLIISPHYHPLFFLLDKPFPPTAPSNELTRVSLISSRARRHVTRLLRSTRWHDVKRQRTRRPQRSTSAWRILPTFRSWQLGWNCEAISPSSRPVETVKRSAKSSKKKVKKKIESSIINPYFSVILYNYLIEWNSQVNLTVSFGASPYTNSTTILHTELGSSTGKNRSPKPSWRAFKYNSFIFNSFSLPKKN